MEREDLFQLIKKLISKIMYFQIKTEKLLANFDIQKLSFEKIGSLKNMEFSKEFLILLKLLQESTKINPL